MADDQDVELDKLERQLEKLRARQAARAEKERAATLAREQAALAEAMRPESITARKLAREQARAKAEAALRAPVRVRFGGLARRGLFIDDAMTEVAPAAKTFTVVPDSDERFVTITATRSDLLELAVKLQGCGEPGRRASKCIQAAIGRPGPAQMRPPRAPRLGGQRLSDEERAHMLAKI